MSSIFAFLRPVVASFIVCMLLSWGVAEFRLEARLKTAQAAAPAPRVQNVVDATPPTVLAVTLPEASPIADEVAVDDALASLLAAPQPGTEVDATTPAAQQRSDDIASRQRSSLGKSRAARQQNQPPAEGLNNSPSLLGPTSVSAVTPPVSGAGVHATLDHATESLVTADWELMSLDESGVPAGELAASENRRSSTAIEPIVGDSKASVVASFAGDAPALVDAVPEPSTLGLLALGWGTWTLVRRRRIRNVVNQ